MKKLLSRSLRLENLENRILLAVIAGADPAMTAAPQPTSSSYLVTTLADTVDASDGAMSLREAIIAAVNGDTITFASSLAGGTITLSGAALTITQGVTIDATGIAGAGGITIDGNNASRIFFIDGGSATNPVVLNHLKITGGYASYGGAIRVSTGRHLTLIDCAITGNNAPSGGGGVYNTGTARFYGCTIAGNTSQNGSGGVYNRGNYATEAVYFYNTIIAENFGNQGSGQDYSCGSKGVSYAYNTLSSCHKWTAQQGCILYTGGILFTNAAGGDYTLAPQSLAIDQGDNTYATWATDLAGNPRISSLVVDIGAYEYQFPVVPGVTVTGYTGEYDGALHGVTVNGTQSGDVVRYSTDGGQTYSATPPEFFVGNVTVRVKVSRANHNDWFGAADVNIARKQLTVTGTTVADKVYDGTTNATVNLGAVSGRLGTDDVNVTATGAFASANVGTHTVTVTYALTGADANYYIAPATETFTASITKADPAPDAYTLTGYTGTYDGAKHGITVTGTEPGDTILYSTDGINYDTIAPEFFVGSETVYVKISRANYNDWTGSADINIARKQLTITGTSVVSKTYDGTTGAAIVLGTVSGIIVGDDVTVTPSGAFPSADVGDYQVAVTYGLTGAAAQYYLAPAADTCAASITPAGITGVTVTGYTGTYDGAPHGITITGTQPGDTILYSTDGGQTSSATPPEFFVGNVTVRVKVSRANHNDWFGAADVNIARKQLTVTGTMVADKVYDGTTHATVTLGAVDGIVAGDAVTVTPSGTFAVSDVGTHTVTVTYALTGADANYYIAPATETFTASITKADPAPGAYTLTGYTGTYDGVKHGITVTGTEPGDTILYSTDGINYDTIAPEFFVGIETVHVKISRANYNDWTGSADINIARKQLTVTGTAVANKTYDGTTDALIALGAVNGILGSDHVVVTASGAFPSPNVGSYQVAVTYTLSDTDAGYYLAPAADTCAASITASGITGVTVTGYTGTYDGIAHGVTVAGTQPGDTVLYSTDEINYGAAAPTFLFGDATVYVKVSRPNHSDWFGAANVSIDHKHLTVTGTSVADKIYDGTTGATVTLGAVDGIIAGDDVTVTPSGAFASANVGTHNVTVTYTLSGAHAAYYAAPATETFTASITKADPAADTYTLAGYTGTYNGAKHGITVTGMQPGDTILYSTDGVTYSAIAPELFVGSATVYVKISRPNYNDWTGSADINIARKQLTITGTSVVSKTYDGTTGAAIALGTVSGIIVGDDVTVTPSGAFPSADVGDYQVAVTYGLTGAAAQYYLAPAADTCAASITPDGITGITVTGYTGTYDGAAHGITITGTEPGDTILYSTDGGQTSSATPPEIFVGNVTVRVKVSRANHNDWFGAADVNIARKHLTVTGTTVADKVYDGTNIATVTLGAVDGIVAGDAVTVTPTGAFASANVGTHTVTVTYALTGADANYYIAPASETFTASITKADPAPDTYTLTGYTETYDGAKHGITVTGTEPGDTILYSTDGVTYSAIAPELFVGSATVLVRIARPNYADWSGTADIDIARKQLTVTETTVADKVYDGTTDATITLGTVDGIVAGDNVTVTPSGAFSSADVGDYQVAVTYAITGSDYYLAPAADTCAASITAAAIEGVTLTGYTGTYDGAAHTITVNGASATDTILYSTDGGLTYSEDAPEFFVGSATVHVKISRANYNDWTGSADINITPKQLTVTGTSVASKVYDGTTDATITLGTVAGILVGDDVSVTPSGAFPSADVDVYDVAVTYALSGAESEYYLAPAADTCAASITPATIEGVTVTDYTGAYDGAAHGVTLTGTLPDDVVFYSTDGEFYSKTVPQLLIGSETVYVRVGRANHNAWSGLATIDIAPKQLTVTGTTVADKPYDGTTDADVTLGTVEGMIAGDDVTVAATGTFAGSDYGEHTVTVTYMLSGADAGYYALPASETFTARILRPLDAPTILTGDPGVYVSYGANRHRLLWTAIENASAYELTYSADGGGTWSSVTSGTTSGIVRGLSYGDDMVYRVRALGTGDYCDSDWSVTRTFNVCPMDVDNDGDIGPTDLALVLNLWLKSEDDAEYRHYCDIDGDGDIGPTDRVFLKNNWLGESGSADLFYPRPLPAAADTVFDEFGSVDLEVDFDFF